MSVPSSFRPAGRHYRSAPATLVNPLPTVEIDLAAFHAGREDVVHQVYRACAAALLREVGRTTGPAEAEAVVHDVFVELLRNGELRGRFTGGSLLAWLRQIARFKALDHARRARREIPVESPAHDGGPSPEDDLEARDILSRFLQAHVPGEQRRFFELRFLERHTQVEVAAALGVARSTLEGWEHRLTDRLREFLKESDRS